MLEYFMRFTSLLVILLVTATATAAHANIRAPVWRDSSFSEHIRGAHPSAVLLRERFVARLPSLVAGDADSFGQMGAMHARVEVEYDIENTSSDVVTMPVRFLALGASGAAIRINGVDTPHQAITDDLERMSARKRVARHRCAWSEQSKRDDFAHGGDSADMIHFFPGNCALGDDENAARADDWFKRHHRGGAGAGPNPDVFVDTLAFDIALRPGTNTVQVTYEQELRFREGSYGYFSGLGIRGSRYGFEYLLYPAETWRRSEAFTFDVFIDIPDVRERGLLTDSFLASTVLTNLPIDSVRQPHPGTTVSGRLREFPSDVLAVVVVVPHGGMRLF